MTRQATFTLIITSLLITFAPLAPNGLIGPITPTFLQNINLSIIDLLLAIVVLFLTLFLSSTHMKFQKKIPLIPLLLTSIIIWSLSKGDIATQSIVVTSRLILIIWLVYLIYWWMPQWGRHTTGIIIIAIILLQSIWAITQFSLQSDLNLYPLGETKLLPLGPGIATVTIMIPKSEKIIRAYGPYHHPNSLAGSIIIALVLLALIRFKNNRYSSLHIPSGIIYLLAPLTIALLTTLSRAALLSSIILLVTITLPYLRKYYSKIPVAWPTVKKLMLIPVIILVFTPVLLYRIHDKNDRSVPERVSAVSYSLNLIAQQPIYRGVGLGNYTSSLKTYLDDHKISYNPWEIAPVHNTLLLLVSELGVLPTIIIIIILLIQITRAMPRRWPYLLTLLPVLFLDHYFLTQTASLILLACLVVLLAEPSVPHLSSYQY